MGRETYSSEEEVRDVAKKLREHRIPCDVIHLDVGWFAPICGGGVQVYARVDAPRLIGGGPGLAGRSRTNVHRPPTRAPRRKGGRLF
jgi:hypothetical protein